ncbi:MAG: MBL fold metallo-hydrolase [Clostridia bacterium]|nr:MBL fold metallo-hydrolase [Clostridia bacterium]
MKIKFLGTGAAEGVPAMFCGCAYCNAIRKAGKKEFRTRTQILIDGVLSVDFPPEAYVNSLRYGYNLTNLKNILVTHSHQDHFFAHDFILRGYKYAVVAEPVLGIYGNSAVAEIFKECTSHEMKPEVAANIKFKEIQPYSVFNIDGYKVIAIPANHGKIEECLLYYIEKNGKGYLHLHDTGIISDEALGFLAENGAKAQAVAYDCTFVENSGGASARHMGIDDVMLVNDKLLNLGVIDFKTKKIITHFSHNANPTRAHLKKIEKQFGVTAAFDGMEINL